MKNQLFWAVALLAVSTSTASAGTITLAFNGTNLGLSLNGTTVHYDGGTYGGWAGQLKVNVSNDSMFGYNGDKFVFCTELNEVAGRNTDYYLDTLNNLPIPTADPMVLKQKTAMERLFSLVGEVDSDVKAAGFQVAVWEISQDVDYGKLTKTPIIDAGNFYLSYNGTKDHQKVNYDNILDAAGSFLSRLENQNQISVLGMVSKGSQDFVVANPIRPSVGIGSVPEPAAFASFGLIGLIACVRRRTR